MERIKGQFGAEFAEALSRCPTLVSDLSDIRSKGVKIRRVGGHCQAYSMLSKLTIYIGSKCCLTYQLISLAHEMVHMLVSPTPPPVPGQTSRQAFIDMCLEAETDAIVHEVKVVGELIAAGYEVDAHSMKWYRLFNRGGRAAIRKGIEKAFASTTGERYPEYYGGWYDDAIKPQQRLPFYGVHTHGQSYDVSVAVPVLQVSTACRGRVPRERDFCPRFLTSCELPIDISVEVSEPK